MHRYGIWSDTDWHGERLQGMWQHGLPQGPFKARETGMSAYHGCACVLEGILHVAMAVGPQGSTTECRSLTFLCVHSCYAAGGDWNLLHVAGSGSAFVSVQIGYIQNRRDKPTKWGTCHTVPMTAGNVAVECSTSGVFFRGFPFVSFFYLYI